MPTIRVDGNDVFAIYVATMKAREMIIAEKRPVLIEAMSYRVGDHSTSDFSQRYRDEEEMKKWGDLLQKVSNPIHRLEKYLTNKGMITEEKTAKLRLDAKLSVRESLKAASVLKKPNLDSLFEDVYDEIPPHIEEQR